MISRNTHPPPGSKPVSSGAGMIEKFDFFHELSPWMVFSSVPFLVCKLILQ